MQKKYAEIQNPATERAKPTVFRDSPGTSDDEVQTSVKTEDTALEHIVAEFTDKPIKSIITLKFFPTMGSQSQNVMHQTLDPEPVSNPELEAEPEEESMSTPTTLDITTNNLIHEMQSHFHLSLF